VKLLVEVLFRLLVNEVLLLTAVFDVDLNDDDRNPNFISFLGVKLLFIVLAVDLLSLLLLL